jgi:hypothetical protein
MTVEFYNSGTKDIITQNKMKQPFISGSTKAFEE